MINLLSKYEEACKRIFRGDKLDNFANSEEKDMEENPNWAWFSYFGSDNNLIARFKSECFSQDEQAVGSSLSGTETTHAQEGQD